MDVPAPSCLTSDERFNESRILFTKLNFILLDEVIEHHLRRIFVLPVLAFAVASTIECAVQLNLGAEQTHRAFGMNRESQT